MAELIEILSQSFRKEALLRHIQNHPEQIDEAIQLASQDLKPQSWRAAWLLGHCLEANDSRLQEHMEDFIRGIRDKADGHQRELLKIVLKKAPSEINEGKLFDICLEVWEDISKSPSVRIVAFRILAKIASKHPELKSELNFLCDERYTENLSPGIARTFQKIINQ